MVHQAAVKLVCDKKHIHCGQAAKAVELIYIIKLDSKRRVIVENPP